MPRAARLGLAITLGLVAVLSVVAVPAWAATVETLNGLRVVRLSGTPYELGYQHGQALREDIHACLDRVLGYFESYLKIPLVRTLLVGWWLDTAWARAVKFVPPRYLEELRGLADGSGVPLRKLVRLHALPDRTYSCANFAAWGQATVDGRLIHMRNLDWNIRAGIQDHAVVFVVAPKGRHAFISVAWAGFVGVLTGVNDAQLSVGQVGAETTDLSYRGVPMVFLLRRVLEETGDLDAAVRLVQTAPRTVGINYVFAAAGVPRAVAIESTRRRVAVFGPDDAAEHSVAYARPLADVVFRADTAMDPVIRDKQRASHGNPRRPGPEPPGGSAYETRYVGQATRLTAAFGRVDVAAAQAIARAVAPDSNVQSVIFAWPDMWVANAQGTVPAARGAYTQLSAEALLQGMEPAVP